MLKRLFIKRPKDEPEDESNQIKFPVQFELIPDKLSARVYLDDLDTQNGVVPCWTYISNGLWAHRQKELIFSLRRSPEEKVKDFPHKPLEWFKVVYSFAEQGRLVDEGDISEFAKSNFINHKGVLYLPSDTSHNKNLGPSLTAILLTEEELNAVKEFGPTRVMARLGMAYRYYPCPPWAERDRPSLSFARSMQESILRKIPRLRLRCRISVSMENNLITLRALPQASEEMRNYLDQIPINKPLVLLTNLDPSANGCLVWEPGQSGTHAITPPNSSGNRMCGCFMLFVPEKSRDSGGIIEDGFAMELTNKSWENIRQALKTRETALFIANGNGMSFRLEWIPTSYNNPVDGLTYSTETGWNIYGPKSSHDIKDEGSVNAKQIVLLNTDPELAMRVDTNQLSNYIQAIEDVVKYHYATDAAVESHDLIVQLEVWSDGNVKTRFAIRPEIDNEGLQKLHESLVALQAPKVNQDSIKFQIYFTIHGGFL